MRLSLPSLLVAVSVASAACGGGAGGGDSSSPTGPSANVGVTCTPTVYVPSAGATGTISGDQNDCRGWVDVPGAQFTMTLTAQTNLDFTLTASGFVGFLALYTEQNVLIGQVRGAGQHIVALLPAGTYHLSAGSVDNGGRYTLTSTPVTSIADACQPTTLWANAVVGATFTASHASSACSTVIFVRGFSVGQTLSFTLTPDQAMTFGVLPPGATTPAVQRTMPKGAATVLTYTIPSAGEYRIGLFGSSGSPLPIGYTLAIR